MTPLIGYIGWALAFLAAALALVGWRTAVFMSNAWRVAQDGWRDACEVGIEVSQDAGRLTHLAAALTQHVPHQTAQAIWQQHSRPAPTEHDA